MVPLAFSRGVRPRIHVMEHSRPGCDGLRSSRPHWEFRGQDDRRPAPAGRPCSAVVGCLAHEFTVAPQPCNAVAWHPIYTREVSPDEYFSVRLNRETDNIVVGPSAGAERGRAFYRTISIEAKEIRCWRTTSQSPTRNEDAPVGLHRQCERSKTHVKGWGKCRVQSTCDLTRGRLCDQGGCGCKSGKPGCASGCSKSAYFRLHGITLTARELLLNGASPVHSPLTHGSNAARKLGVGVRNLRLSQSDKENRGQEKILDGYRERGGG